MKNLELKFRCDNLSEIETKCCEIGAKYVKTMHQYDIFYNVSLGRLKLRIEDGKHPCLVAYHRPNVAKAKVSDYQLAYCTNATDISAVLDQTLGRCGEVRKQRTLYQLQNIRIHLDKVEELGDFIEFESVLDEDCDVDFEKKKLAELVHKLSIDQSLAIKCAYHDLLKEQKHD